MRIGKLALRLYLFSIGTVVATAATIAAIGLALESEHRQTLILASGHVVHSEWLELEARRAAARPRSAVSIPELPVTFYDSTGRLLASTASPPLPMPSASALLELREKGVVDVGHGVLAHAVKAGARVAAIGVVKLGGVPSLSRVSQWLGLLLSVLLGGALLFARGIARPLERVAAATKRFGAGDLTARVGTIGNDEIGEVGRAFDATAARVAGLMSAQQQLMANVSHELRTPISRVQVAVDLIADDKVEQAKELVPEISQDLAELERLLDDVMIVAKLDLARSNGVATVVPLRLESTPLGALVDDAARRFRTRHPARQLVVDSDPDLPAIWVDPVLVRRTMDNLLENAEKFSDDDTPIRLSTQLKREARVVVSVTDRGIGIGAAEIEKVFSPFYRGDKSRSRATGGVGLGLALAKSIVEAHGGTIAIQSQRDRGTTVSLALPTSRQESAGALRKA